MKPSIPAVRGQGGGLVMAPAKKASLLGSQFDSKRCREQRVSPLSCFSQSRFHSLAFRISVLLHLLLALGPYSGVDLGVFPLFLKMIEDIIAPKLNIIFCGLIRRGLFPGCWRSASVTVIPNHAPSPDRENYRPK